MRNSRLLLLLILLHVFANIHAKKNEAFPTNSPKAFIQNKGQILDQNYQLNPSVLFLWNGPGMNVQLRKNGFSYDNWRRTSHSNAIQNNHHLLNNVQPLVQENPEVGDTTYFHRIDFEFENANSTIPISTYGETNEPINYYINTSHGEGITGIKQFEKVVYNNVWNGIDIEFILSDNKPKYNIIVHRGAKVSDIQLKISGADGISENNGQLILSNTIHDITETIPASYFLRNGTQIPVTSSFNKLNDQVYGITLAETMSSTDELVIDPVPNLNWCTYYGGNYAGFANVDETYSICSDGAGNTVVTGYTNSTFGNLASSGAYQSAYAGGADDAFIAKFNSSGQRLWSTYYGGGGDDQAYGIVMDPSGNCYITGSTTSSSGLSTTGSLYQPNYGGAGDAFLVKFSSTGTLVWATYFGGGGAESAYGIAIDLQNNIIICGQTTSTTTIATAGTQQTTIAAPASSGDGYLAKFNSSGQKLWGTYYGGTSSDFGRAVCTDISNNIVLTGFTQSSSGIATSGTYSQSLFGNIDLFIARFNSSGQRLWGSYYGGSSWDYPYTVICDPAKNIYFCGQTNSSNGISTTGAFQATNSGGGGDGYLVKFDTTGQLKWGTYLGGSGQDDAYSLTLDGSANIYMGGTAGAGSTGLATGTAYQTTMGAGTDAMIFKFDSSGLRLWSTYYGGSGNDNARGIILDGQGKVVITGATGTVSGFATSGTYQTTYGGGNEDAFVANFTECVPGFGTASSNAPLCAGISLSLTASGGSTYAWSGPKGFTSSQQSPVIVNPDSSNSGTYTVIIGNGTGCNSSKNVDVTIYPFALPRAGYSQNKLQQCFTNNSFTLQDTSKVSSGSLSRIWKISNGDTSTSSTLNKSFLLPGTYSVKLVVTSGATCSDSVTKTLSVYAQTNIGYTVNNASQCAPGNNFLFTDTSTISTGTYTRLWYFGDGTNSVNSSFNKNYNSYGTYTSKLITTTDHGCLDSVQQTINVWAQPTSGYTQNSFAQCLTGNSFSITDTSKIVSGNLILIKYYDDGIFGASGTPGGGFVVNGFTTPGVHTIKLVAQSNNNCFDSTTKNFTVYPQTNLGFTVNGSSQCLTGNNFTFTDTSSGTYTRLWDFGDATTSASQVVVKSYASSGSYNVKLKSTTLNGCVDSVIKNIVVNNYPQPVVGYTQNNFAQCLSSNAFLLNDTSTISSGTISRQWIFSDGGSSAASNFNKSFSSAGTFSIKLIETSNNGCQDSVSKTFTVYPQTTIGFNTNNQVQCFNTNSFVYTDTSAVSSGSYTRLWRLGDGSTSAAAIVTKSYLATGTYQVKLITTTNNGCLDSVQKNMTVGAQPSAGFTQNNFAQCLSGNSFSLTDTSFVPSGTYTVLWKFSDLTTSTSNSLNKSFSGDGTYTVKLIATSQSGCSDSVSKIFTVYPQTNIGFSANSYSQCFAGNDFIFSDTSAVSSGSFTRLWHLGDGATSAAVSVNKSYLTENSFQVKLNTTTNQGCLDSVQKTVVVKVQPKAGFTQNNFAQCLSGNSFTLTDTSFVSSGTTTTLWRFSDLTSSASNPTTKSFGTDGSVTATLVATSQSGCSDSVLKNFTVYPQTKIGFSSNTYSECFNGNNFSLNDTSSVSSGTFSRLWKLGDGSTSNSVSFGKSYLNPGTYQVKLITSTNNNCVDSLQKTFVVNVQPKAGFTENNTSQCLSGNVFSLNDTSFISSGTYNRNWSFSDGDTSTLSSVNKSFSSSGIFNAKLVATSPFGCSDSTTKVFTVYPQTKVGFIITNPNQCLLNNLFSITDTSSISSGSFSRSWNLGDATTATSVFVNKSYAAAGSYVISLTTTSNNGCMDSAQKIATLAIQPKAGFTQNNLSECFNGNSFSLSDTSSLSSGSYTRLWKFGNGDTSSAVNPVESFSSAGTYAVKLVSSSSIGCSDSVSKTLNVFPPTVVGFSVNNPTQCYNGNNFLFIDTSFLATGSFTRSWTFGDGSASASYLIGKSYTTPGVYPVILKTITNYGCADSITKNIVVNAQPKAGFTQNNFTQCFAGNNFILTDTSTSPTGAYIRNWYFSDSQTDTASAISKSFAAGTISAKLLVNSPNGCSDSVIKNFIVYPQTNIGFYTSNSNQCQGNNLFLFSDTSTILSGAFKRQWDFGDGSSSTAMFSNKSYSASGNYTVTLTTTSDFGCMDSVKNVINVYAQPRAGFSQNNFAQCLTGNVFQLNDTSTMSSGSFNRLWKFSDGDTSTSISVNKNFKNFGTFTVSLLVSSVTNCSDSVKRTFTVYPQTSIDFNITGSIGQCFSGNYFVFDDVSSSYSGPYSRHWDFGDGNFNSIQLIPKSYLSYGTYPVKLTTTTVDGCVDSIVKSVMVYPQPLTAFSLSSQGMCFTGNNFALIDTSKITQGNLSRFWYFSDGDTTTADSFNKSFVSPGSYRVTLYEVSDKFCIDSAVKTISVYANPLVGFSQNDTLLCFNGNNFHFTDTSITSPSTASRYWDFGDGSIDSNANEFKSYLFPGNYLVKLIVQSGNYCSDSISKIVSVHPNPVAAFSQNNTSQCFTGNAFNLSDNSTIPYGNLSSYWNFGDSSFSNLSGLIKSFTKPGSYRVKLISISDYNCRDSVTRTFTVFPKTSGGFNVNQAIQCSSDNKFLLTDTTLNSSSRTWYFGDSTTGKSNQVTKSYTTFGYYTVSLKVTDINNCTDSVSSMLTVNISPSKPVITVLSRTQLQSSAATRYQWLFDNDTLANSNIQILNIASNGLYRVKSISTNGCTNFSDSVYIKNADFASSNGNIVMNPNPARDKVIIDFNGIGGDKTVEIFNTSGTLIQQINTSDLTLIFPLDNFTSGIYIVRVTTQGGTLIKKLLIE
ncbi:MAG: PKD domain-containing protein [Bacteroidia bacterium]